MQILDNTVVFNDANGHAWEFRVAVVDGEAFAFAAYGLSRVGGVLRLQDVPRSIDDPPVTDVATPTAMTIHDVLDTGVPLIHMTGLPTSSDGLQAGMFWLSAGQLELVVP
ncbi:MAG TPA: hypothetical protein VHZ73_02395 [Vicinamibacterales bacterium]|jgi:hypothetical protein|nr:hypothetical protein [Vicinamibacterales bacterium]